MTRSTPALVNLQTYYHQLTSPNLFLSLLTYAVIHWTTLSLLLLVISPQQYHHLYYCIWSLSYLYSPQPYTHTSSPSKITLRRTKNIVEFNNDLASSDLILYHPKSLPESLDSYDSTLYTLNYRQACSLNY